MPDANDLRWKRLLVRAAHTGMKESDLLAILLTSCASPADCDSLEELLDLPPMLFLRAYERVYSRFGSEASCAFGDEIPLSDAALSLIQRSFPKLKDIGNIA